MVQKRHLGRNGNISTLGDSTFTTPIIMVKNWYAKGIVRILNKTALDANGISSVDAECPIETARTRTPPTEPALPLPPVRGCKGYLTCRHLGWIETREVVSLIARDAQHFTRVGEFCLANVSVSTPALWCWTRSGWRGELGHGFHRDITTLTDSPLLSSLDEHAGRRALKGGGDAKIPTPLVRPRTSLFSRSNRTQPTPRMCAPTLVRVTLGEVGECGDLLAREAASLLLLVVESGESA